MIESLPRWVRRAFVILGTVAVILGVALRWVVVKMDEAYTGRTPSTSSAHAESRGLLQSRHVASPDAIVYLADTLRIVDAWVEQVIHVEYRWYLWRREVRDPRYRLVLTASRDWRPNYRCSESLYADSLSLGSINTDRFFHEGPSAEFPDTIRLNVERRGEC